MDDECECLSFVGRQLPLGFAARQVTIDPGCERRYEPTEWSDALVVLEAGDLELECISGTRARFDGGAVLFLDSLPLRTLRSCGPESVLLTAVTRIPMSRRTPLRHMGEPQAQRSNAMKRVIVQYRVKPDQVERNEALIRAVYEEIDRTQPEGLRYATLRLDDGVTFIHIAEQPESSPSPLSQIEAFQRFTAGIGDRCDQAPIAKEAREVGSFRMFD